MAILKLGGGVEPLSPETPLWLLRSMAGKPKVYGEAVSAQARRMLEDRTGANEVTPPKETILVRQEAPQRVSDNLKNEEYVDFKMKAANDRDSREDEDLPGFPEDLAEIVEDEEGK